MWARGKTLIVSTLVRLIVRNAYLLDKIITFRKRLYDIPVHNVDGQKLTSCLTVDRLKCWTELVASTHVNRTIGFILPYRLK